MPNYVQIDDKITRVTPDYTICETVESVTREGFATKSAPGLTSLRHASEGITWVRGWHLPDSEEVKAARVAQSLDENKEQAQTSTPIEELLRQAMQMGAIPNPPYTPPPMPPSPWPGPPAPMLAPQPGWIGTPGGIGIVTPTTTVPDVDLQQFPFGKTTC